MALNPKPTCHIQDYAPSLVDTSGGTAEPSYGGVVIASPSATPLFVLQQDGSWELLQSANLTATINPSTGLFDLYLPALSDCDPSTVTWTITLPNGIAWNGHVTSAMVTASAGTPYSIANLKNLTPPDNWGLVVQVGAPVTVLTGPQGPQGIQGPAGTGTTPATDTAIGSVYRRELNVRNFYPSGIMNQASDTHNPLSGYYATLLLAQADYPFATSLTQEVDYCAIQKAINVALGDATGGGSPGAANYPIITVNDGAMAGNGSATLNSGSALFVLGDVNSNIVIAGAGAGGLPYTGTIFSFTSSSQVTVSPAPPSGSPVVSGAQVSWARGGVLGTRTAKSGVYIPGGKYRITTPISITAASGLYLSGDGESSVIRADATMQAAIAGDGVAYSVFENFLITGTGNEVLQAGIQIEWSGNTITPRSSFLNRLVNLNVENTKFVVGIGLGWTPISKNLQVSEHAIKACNVAGPSGNAGGIDGTYWQHGIKLGNGTFGNNLDHHVRDCTGGWCKYGVSVDAVSATITDHTPGYCYADFYLNTAEYCRISGVRSEGSGRLYETSGPRSSTALISLTNISWHGNAINSDHYWLKHYLPGSLVIENAQVLSTAGGVNPQMYFAPTTNPSPPPYDTLTFLGVGIQTPSPYTSCMVWTSNTYPHLLSYRQIDPVFGTSLAETTGWIVGDKITFARRSSGNSPVALDSATFYSPSASLIQTDGGLQVGGTFGVTGTALFSNTLEVGSTFTVDTGDYFAGAGQNWRMHPSSNGDILINYHGSQIGGGHTLFYGGGPTKIFTIDGGGHLLSTGTALTAAAGSEAGSSPPAPVVTGTTDTRGIITFGTGTGAVAGHQVLATFATTYTGTPSVVITPLNAATAALNLYVAANLSASFAVSCVNAPASGSPNTTYAFSYIILA